MIAVMAFLRAVPRGAWIGLALLALLLLGKCAHDDAVSDARKAVIAERDKAWQGAFDKMRSAAAQWRTNHDEKAAQLAASLQAAHRAQLRDNLRSADALVLRGPGRAAFTGCGPGRAAELSAPAGGARGAAPGPDAPVAPVLADEPLAIVPWSDLVRRAREHDDLLSEVKTWRTWYAKERGLYQGSVAELSKIRVEF